MKKQIEIQRCEVASYIDPIKADMVKELLENEGVLCFIENANTSNANLLYTSAIGGINIIVNKNDLEKAKEIINIFESNPDEEKMLCSECKKSDFKEINPHWILALIFIFFFFIPSPLRKRKYKCNYCGKIMEKSKE